MREQGGVREQDRGEGEQGSKTGARGARKQDRGKGSKGARQGQGEQGSKTGARGAREQGHFILCFRVTITILGFRVSTTTVSFRVPTTSVEARGQQGARERGRSERQGEQGVRWCEGQGYFLISFRVPTTILYFRVLTTILACRVPTTSVGARREQGGVRRSDRSKWHVILGYRVPSTCDNK